MVPTHVGYKLLRDVEWGWKGIAAHGPPENGKGVDGIVQPVDRIEGWMDCLG